VHFYKRIKKKLALCYWWWSTLLCFFERWKIDKNWFWICCAYLYGI